MKDMETLFPGCSYIVKCFDDDMPSLPKYRSKGIHGTAIVWKSDIDELIQPQPDGSSRVNVILVNTKPDPLLIINTYMLTLGRTDEYSEFLAEVQEIMSKFNHCTTLWTGDINASVTREKNTKNDDMFQQFCNEQSLVVSHHMPKDPTYYPFNNKCKDSTIDLYVHRKNDNPVASIKTHVKQPFNTNPHNPVTATLNATLTTTMNASKTSNQLQPESTETR